MNMKAHMSQLLFVLLLLLPAAAFARAQNYYAVQFSDKKHNTYSLNKPQEFLSDKAINRRIRQNIPIAETDLPITQGYLYQLNKIENVRVVFVSRWLNTAIVECNDTELEEIQSGLGVASVHYIGKRQDYQIIINEKVKEKSRAPVSDNSFYGASEAQITMVNGHKLHEKKYFGQGMTVAVLDAGFWQADQLELMPELQNVPSYAHKDFVDMDDDVFNSSAHGTKVLSVMAANLPGVMVGTAPSAEYVCIRTEDMRGEFYLDEYSWIAGLEYADQIGADVIVSGLGYTLFNDSKMNYSHADLQDNKAISSRGANIAFTKGMIIVCSGGNEGDNDWKYVSCPGDASSVLSVGAVTPTGELAPFSSRFTEIRENIKPDITAPGQDIYVAAVKGRDYITTGTGTSYAAPIAAGLATALWGAFPSMTNQQVTAAIRQSAEGRKNLLPDFEKAYRILQEANSLSLSKSVKIKKG